MPSSHGPAEAMAPPKSRPASAPATTHGVRICPALIPRLISSRLTQGTPRGIGGWTGPGNSLLVAPAEREGFWGLGMTYCCGILVRDGLVMIADTRTNAGLDNVSTFRKLHIFTKPGERVMAIASAGNLAISQSVLSTLTEGLEDPQTGASETLMNAPTMFQASQRIGRA